MITSPYPSVTPEKELARLTLISSTNEAAIRRKSTISGNQPGGLGEKDGMPVMGPLGPPQTTAEQDGDREGKSVLNVKEEQKAAKESASDADSEATLVSDGLRTETQTSRADNKENQPPPPFTDVVEESKPDVTPVVDSSTPPSNSQAVIGPIGPPNRPPPVPPRPSPQVDHQRQLIEEVEMGAQQDVTEVINNVLFQSQCAIRPRAIAPDGEQLDQIKE